MNKTLQAASNFLKPMHIERDFKEGFESLSFVKTPTISIPVTLELTDQEKRAIEKILVDDYQPGTLLENEVADHVEQLTNITKQIKSISAQSILLHGERIQQAQQILAKYRDGAFSKWLMAAYGNKQTPYSMLRYFEFYQDAPQDARVIIQAAPKKAIYLLATRDGEQSKKLELIKNHSKATQSDLVLLIESTFPVKKPLKRKPLMASTIAAMSKLCLKLEKRAQHINEEDRQDIKKLIQRLQDISVEKVDKVMESV